MAVTCAVSFPVFAAQPTDTNTPTATRKGTIESFQSRVNNEAKKLGIPAPDVRKMLIAENDRLERENQLKRDNPIDRMVTIETDKIQAIKTKEGEMLYLVAGGRYAIAGVLIDVWSKKALDKFEDVAYSATHMPLKRMGFDSADYNSIKIGNGPKTVTIFADTQCGWCHKLLEEINEQREELKDYTFHVVFMTILGPGSRTLGERLACAKADDEAKLKAFLEGPDAINALELKEPCDLTITHRTDAVRTLMNVRSVPMIVAPDERFARGKPQDLRAFLDPVDVKKLLKEEKTESVLDVVKQTLKAEGNDPTKTNGKDAENWKAKNKLAEGTPDDNPAVEPTDKSKNGK